MIRELTYSLAKTAKWTLVFWYGYSYTPYSCLVHYYIMSNVSYLAFAVADSDHICRTKPGCSSVILKTTPWLVSVAKLVLSHHDDVLKWKHFPRYWPFVRGIHRSPVNSPHEGQWCGAWMFSIICALTNGWENHRDAGDLRRHRAHYDVTVM